MVDGITRLAMGRDPRAMRAKVPLVSAATLARGMSLAVKTAIGLLESLVTAGVAVEVTHRAKRRLFGLVGLAPLAAVVRPPGRPVLGGGRGRPPLIVEPPNCRPRHCRHSPRSSGTGSTTANSRGLWRTRTR
jgi:hypothetical protein